MVTERLVEDDWRCPQLGRVVHNVNTARKLERLTDVTFVVGPDGDSCTIKAHRVVVGTANDELAKLVSDIDDSGRIRMPDVPPKGFKNLIRFLYDVDVKFSDLSRVRETYFVAEKFKVYKLKLATETYFNQTVVLETILEMLDIAIEFKMPILESKCIDIISSKYPDVLKSEGLISSPFEVIATVLSVRPCHGENCQNLALKAVGEWKKRQKADPMHLAYLLKCVDFTRVDIKDFEKFSKNEESLSDADKQALRRCVLQEDIGYAPEWYRASEYALDKKDNNDKEPARKECKEERNFLQDLELEKLKIKKTLDEEFRYMDKLMVEAADVSSELHKKALNESVRAALDLFTDVIKEAVDTAVESLEYDMSSYDREDEEKKVKESIHAATEAGVEKESIHAATEAGVEKESIHAATEAGGEKESIQAATELSLASDIDKLSISEKSSIKQKCTDSKED